MGDVDEALEAFYQSVDIRPDYPIGWFNIGVVEGSRPGFRHFLRSQGALGKAGSLDHDYRDRDTSLAFDDEIYDSGLDLSQPIPKDWQLASTQRSRPSKLGLGLVFLVMLRVAWALGSDWAVGRSYEHTITKEAPKWPRLRRILESRPTAWWTSVVSLVGLLLLTGVSGTREAALGLVLFTALLAAHALAPRFAHHGDTRLRQASFLPASIFTAALVPLGLGFTPPAPLSNDDVQVSPLVRRSGALTLGLLTAALACVAWLTAVPVARTGATAGLLLVSSALVPVAPLDGARLDLSKAREVGVALAIAGGTVLFAAGVI